MKNPCDNCIIKVNCTQICLRKENNAALIKNSIAPLMRKGKINPDYIAEWRKYNGMYNQCLTDIALIQMRAREAKEGNSNF